MGTVSRLCENSKYLEKDSVGRNLPDKDVHCFKTKYFSFSFFRFNYHMKYLHRRKVFCVKTKYLFLIMENYNHRLKELSTNVLAMHQRNELTESSKVFPYSTTVSQNV